MGRIGLAAAMLLLTVPTAGRLLQASAPAGHGHVAHHDRHGGQQARRSAHAGANGDRAGQGGLAPDCDYCPLLASLVSAAQASYALAMAPAASAVAALPTSPRLPWLHPSGLGSRGPPAFG